MAILLNLNEPNLTNLFSKLREMASCGKKQLLSKPTPEFHANERAILEHQHTKKIFLSFTNDFKLLVDT